MKKVDSDKHSHHGEGAFTLVELLIVMVIIGILMAIVSILANKGDDLTRQQAMAAVAGQVLVAAEAFDSDFPAIGASDPLVSFTARQAIRMQLLMPGQSPPDAESGEKDYGFFGKNGEALIKSRLESPYGGEIRVERGCPPNGVAGTVYVCRPGSSGSNQLRVTAWARSNDGSTPIKVYDELRGR